MVSEYDIPTSRLLRNTEKLRQTLYSRNLYAPDTQYPLQNESNVNRTVDAINTIIGGLTPFKSFNLENTVFGRTFENRTPLTNIGLIMLGKQFALNAMSGMARENFPVVKVSNLFDGNKNTNLFTKHIDYDITIKEDTTKFENFIDSIIYWYPLKNYPFNPKSINSDYIKNTGSGQLNILYQNINNNIYKQNNNNSDTTFYDYADKVDNPIKPRTAQIFTFFSFDESRVYPLGPLGITETLARSVELANKAMSESYYNIEKVSSEYAPTIEYLGNFGDTEKNNNNNKQWEKDGQNPWIDNYNEFAGDNSDNRIVWGRDGITKELNNEIGQLRGDLSDSVFKTDGDLKNFGVNTGLLEYTRNLVNATVGKIGDMTRKAFLKGNNIEGFNGAGLWKANSSTYASSVKNTIAGKKGIRQHTAVDQYDRFAKAIRFDGNNVYGGNENSVIYNSVLPRIHPVINKEGQVDPKNLMLSIENLAIRVIRRDGYGIIDNEYGSPIPECEIGPFDGRIMWFPPFNMEIQETATAKYEPTVMIGRNEPMYNYQNSERSAVLNFTLLIDYPPQLKNYALSKTPQKDMAEFFAFGGDSYKEPKSYIEDLELKSFLLQNQINDVWDRGAYAETNLETPSSLKLYFPNNVPKVSDNLNTIVDAMYKTYTYEIINGFPSCDGTGWGLNNEVYFVNGLVSYQLSGNTYWKLSGATSSQYNFSGDTDQSGNCELNISLKKMFDNPDYRKYYNIEITGGASLLYTEGNPKDIKEGDAYNLALGQRRADATKVLIENRLKAIYGKSVTDLGINIITTASKGSAGGNASGATAAGISLLETKEERSAEISFVKNNTPPDRKYIPLTTTEQTSIKIKTDEIDKIQAEINKAKSIVSDCVMSERIIAESNGLGDGGILRGFQSVAGNYYYPVFHSQTPEDFHKRLTFLQQCTRQGAAKRYEVVDNNGILRAKNSVFGRQPICILRIGDFFYTKVIIESVNFDYTETTWDMNPEGFGMQPMLAKITLNMKLIGGQSLKGPIDALQNAVAFNYYANSNYTNKGMYKLPSREADIQASYMDGILTTEQSNLKAAYAQNVGNNVVNFTRI
jgi:hypothetical protein